MANQKYIHNPLQEIKMKSQFFKVRHSIPGLIVTVFILTLGLGTTILNAQEAKAPDDKQVSGTEVPSAFKTQLFEAVKIYLELKDVLVAAEAEQAKKKAKALNAALLKIDGNVLKGDLKKSWDEIIGKLKASSEVQTQKTDIKAQRKAFYPLTQALISAIEAFGPFEISLYTQHCPMAFENTGGDWVSDSKDIRNPYFGSMMLKCGSVKQTFSHQNNHSEQDQKGHH